MVVSIRDMYTKHGVSGYYINHGSTYRNPHESVIRSLLKNENIKGTVLDLCCGTGEVTLSITGCEVIGCDAYLYGEYEKRTGNICLKLSFDDIINGFLDNYEFDIVICSFALHLCEKSKLETLLYQLAKVSKEFILITPNKKPEISELFWCLCKDTVLDRVNLRRYKRNINIF